MKSVHLQQKIEQELRAVGRKVSEPQLRNLALLSHALAVSFTSSTGSCSRAMRPISTALTILTTAPSGADTIISHASVPFFYDSA